MDSYQEVFGQIYDQNIDKIYRFIFLKVNSQETAEDLTSETFLKGWRTFQDREKKIDNPSAFLYQIARNLIIDFYRERGKMQIVSTENVQIDDPRNNLEEKLLLSSDMDIIRRALSSLKEDYQTVVICHYLNDLPVPEIAKIMEKPEGTVRVTLHRALKALKKELGPIQEA